MIPISSMIYMVFVGSTLHDVINARTDLDWDVRIYILLAAVPAIGITQVREIKYLVPFSAIATTLIFANVVISLYYIFKEPLSFDDRDLFPSFNSLTTFLGYVKCEKKHCYAVCRWVNFKSTITALHTLHLMQHLSYSPCPIK